MDQQRLEFFDLRRVEGGGRRGEVFGACVGGQRAGRDSERGETASGARRTALIGWERISQSNRIDSLTRVRFRHSPTTVHAFVTVSATGVVLTSATI